MGQIRGLLQQEMPREKLINSGPVHLTDVELLAILLRTGNKNKNVIELSREILQKFDTQTISRKSFNELLEFDGINTAKATQIVALFELARRLHKPNFSKLQFLSSKKVYSFIKGEFLHLKHEKVIAIFVNTKNCLIKQTTLSLGGHNYSTIDPQKIFKHALEYDAHGFFLIHNHPTGDQTPSEEDIIITERINKISKSIGIKFLDHLIIGDDYYSFHDNNLL